MGKFGNIKSFFSAKGLDSGESVEKFKQGLNDIANTYRLFTTMLLQIESTDDWSKKKNELRKNSSSPQYPPLFQYQCKVRNLSAIYLNSHKQHIFNLIEVICQTQNFSFFLMSNFPWQVMIAQNLREYHLPNVQHASCNLKAISNHNI